MKRVKYCIFALTAVISLALAGCARDSELADLILNGDGPRSSEKTTLTADATSEGVPSGDSGEALTAGDTHASDGDTAASGSDSHADVSDIHTGGDTHTVGDMHTGSDTHTGDDTHNGSDTHSEASDSHINEGGTEGAIIIYDDLDAEYDPSSLSLFGDRTTGKGSAAYSVDRASRSDKALAASGIEVPEGYSVIRVTLRRGLYNVSGEDIGAADVISSIDAYSQRLSNERVELVDRIIAAGINRDASFPFISGVKPAEQNSVWSLLDKAGERFASDIIDYVNDKYATDKYVSAFFSDGMTYDEIAQDDALRTAYAFVIWGFGRDKYYYSSGDRVFTDCYLQKYDLDDEGMGPDDLWRVIRQYHGLDLSEDGIDYEKAPDSSKTIREHLRAVALENIKTVTDHLSGIGFGQVMCDDGYTRECIYLVADPEFDMSAFDLPIV